MANMHELDARFLSCPMPLLKLRKELAQMQSGDQVCVYTTDPGAYEDFTAFCERSAHKLINMTQTAEGFALTVECGES